MGTFKAVVIVTEDGKRYHYTLTDRELVIAGAKQETLVIDYINIALKLHSKRYGYDKVEDVASIDECVAMAMTYYPSERVYRWTCLCGAVCRADAIDSSANQILLCPGCKRDYNLAGGVARCSKHAPVPK